MNKFISVIAVSLAFLTPSLMADSILPADLASKFTDGLADIGILVGLIFGVLTTIYIFRAVKKMLA